MLAAISVIVPRARHWRSRQFRRNWLARIRNITKNFKTSGRKANSTFWWECNRMCNRDQFTRLSRRQLRLGILRSYSTYSCSCRYSTWFAQERLMIRSTYLKAFSTTQPSSLSGLSFSSFRSFALNSLVASFLCTSTASLASSGPSASASHSSPSQLICFLSIALTLCVPSLATRTPKMSL